MAGCAAHLSVVEGGSEMRGGSGTKGEVRLPLFGGIVGYFSEKSEIF